VIDKKKAAFLEVTPLGLAEIYGRFAGSHCWYLCIKFDGDYLPSYKHHDYI